MSECTVRITLSAILMTLVVCALGASYIYFLTATDFPLMKFVAIAVHVIAGVGIIGKIDKSINKPCKHGARQS
jgi:hypothetical protein